MKAFFLHGGDLELGDWLLLALFWIVLPLALLVFLSFRLGAYLRKRDRGNEYWASKPRLTPLQIGHYHPNDSTLPLPSANVILLTLIRLLRSK